MESVDLLARENEYKKLNQQLEKQTENLMKEIEQTINRQDFCTDFSNSLAFSPYYEYPIKKHNCNVPKSQSEQSTPVKIKRISHISADKSPDLQSKGNDAQSCPDCVKRFVCDGCLNERRRDRINQDLKFLNAFVDVSVRENVLPPTFSKEGMSVENVCKFLSSKVKLMQEQIDKLQASINKKARQCEAHLSKQAEVETERRTLLNKYNKLQSSTTTSVARLRALNRELEEKEYLYQEHRTENDKLLSEIKKVRSKNITLEARCVSLEDKVDCLKLQLKTAKKAEKELRESSRSLTSFHAETISKLEERIKALVTRASKQTSLINNLKEQRVYLTSNVNLDVLEQQFKDYLLKDF